jgi:hypothetical protein
LDSPSGVVGEPGNTEEQVESLDGSNGIGDEHDLDLDLARPVSGLISQQRV